MPRGYRGAIGTGALGVALILLAGLFDAEPLYVPGLALPALALASACWVAIAAPGLHVNRRLSAARVEEDQPLLVEVAVAAGRLPPGMGTVRDPLLAGGADLRPAARRTRVRINARFSGRGRRVLPPPSVVVRDPLGLVERTVAGAGGCDEVLVLPRVEPVRAPRGGGAGRADGAARLAAVAEADLDGLRAHRPGAPASRIAWAVYARSGELHERRLTAGGDARPLVVLDLSGTSVREDADAAVRAAASLVVHLAERGGCALLLSGQRRPLTVDPGLRAWPAAHARLALADGRARPFAGALAGRAGAVVWVSAARRREAPAALARGGAGAPRALVVPGRLGGRPALLEVAGCTGYEIGARARRRAPSAAGGAAP